MTENDWQNIDLDSRNLIMEWLRSHNVKAITPTTGNCCIDLIFDTGKCKVGVEIKDRTFPSSRFGDVFAEEIKQIGSQRRIENGQFEKVIAINVFTDGIFAIANLMNPNAKHIRRMCPLTSLVKGESNQYVMKDCLSLPQQMKIRYWKANGKWNFKRI